MIAEWMAYWLTLSALVAVAALLGDRACRMARRPLRWVWMIGLTLCVTAPFAAGGGRWAWHALIAPARTLPVHHAAPVPRVPVATIVRIKAQRLESPLAALDPWLVAAWVLASLAMAAKLVDASRRMTRAQRDWTSATVEACPLLVAPDTGPAVAGWLRPRIVLPAWALHASRGDLELIVLHESEHVRARDPRLLLYAAAMVVLLPWNVVLWWLVHRLRRAIELDCDARVLRHAPDVAAYGALLIEVGRRATTGPAVMLAPLSAGHTLLEQRIHMMTNRPMRNSLLAALALCALSAAPAAAGTLLPQPAVTHPAIHAPWMARTPGGDSASLAAVLAMKTALRKLIVAQEQYFADHGQYAPDVARMTQYATSAGLHIRFTWSSGYAYVATATDDGSPGATCVVYIGWIPASAWPATRVEHQTGDEGAPACEGDGKSAHARWGAYARASIVSQLARLAAVQEKAHAALGVYPDDAGQIWANRFDPALHFTYLQADSASWAVRAAYDGEPGKSCVVWGGAAPASRVATDAAHRTGGSDTPVCDDF
ncbi:MAG TPA: M56 family metallopeptidase [Gemmatimonadaceae bacterium]|nr:M56 family metallopeptidase [Gemmatimonadaceae bacterium]